MKKKCAVNFSQDYVSVIIYNGSKFLWKFLNRGSRGFFVDQAKLNYFFCKSYFIKIQTKRMNNFLTEKVLVEFFFIGNLLSCIFQLVVSAKLGRIFVSFRFFSVSIHYLRIFVTETNTNTFLLPEIGYQKKRNFWLQ